MNKKIRIRKGYSQASVIGGALICNESLYPPASIAPEYEEFSPTNTDHYLTLFQDWKETRKKLKTIF